MLFHSRRSLILGAGAAIITRPAQAAIPFTPSNPLAWPGGNPGFDQGHFALENFGNTGTSKVIRASVAATGKGLIRLDKTGTINIFGAAWTYAPDPVIGPCINYPTGASSTPFMDIVQESPAADTFGVTFAGICRNTLGSGNKQTFMASAGGTALFCRLQSNAWFMASGASSASTLQAFANVPYFVAMSCKTATPFTFNYVMRDLGPGVSPSVSASAAGILTLTGTFASMGNDSGNTTFTIGGGGSTDNFQGAIATAAMIRNYLPMATLLRWAGNPWDFWYPPTQRNLMVNSIANPNGSSPAGGGFRPLTGVGL